MNEQPELRLERLRIDHRDRFIEAVIRSSSLLQPWVSPPDNPAAFDRHLQKYSGAGNIALVSVLADGNLAACVNLNEIVRGIFQSAYLGYFAFLPHAGHGLMKRTLQLAIRHAFGELALHRLEANIQPANLRSKGLVRSLGFRLEGYSPRYLNIGRIWQDHERYALTAEEAEAM